jgi:hypothetical protein
MVTCHEALIGAGTVAYIEMPTFQGRRIVARYIRGRAGRRNGGSKAKGMRKPTTSIELAAMPG